MHTLRHDPASLLDDAHVIPVYDLLEHEPLPHCWCQPTQDIHGRVRVWLHKEYAVTAYYRKIGE